MPPRDAYRSGAAAPLRAVRCGCGHCEALAAAVIPVVADLGLPATTLTDLAEHARRAERQRCPKANLDGFVATVYLESAFGLQDAFGRAFDDERSWRAGVRRAVGGLLDTAAREPERARLSYVEILNGSSALRSLRLGVRHRSTRIWSHQYTRLGTDPLPSLTYFDVVNGSIVHQIADAAARDSTGELPELRDAILAAVIPE
jgi:hypothetical protein